MKTIEPILVVAASGEVSIPFTVKLRDKIIIAVERSFRLQRSFEIDEQEEKTLPAQDPRPQLMSLRTLKVSDAARKYRIPDWKLRRLIKAGEIQAIRMRPMLVVEDSLREYIRVKRG